MTTNIPPGHNFFQSKAAAAKLEDSFITVVVYQKRHKPKTGGGIVLLNCSAIICGSEVRWVLVVMQGDHKYIPATW